jgi:hypothetical protein
MKLAFAFLLMTTALGAVSAAQAAGHGLPRTPDANLDASPAPDSVVTLIDGDERGDETDDGDDDRTGNRDDSEDDDDDDCEDEDDACATRAAGNAAPAGTVAPPKNGLFTNGTAPVVKSN